MPTDVLDLSIAYNCGATSHWAVRSYANAHISTDVPNATMFGITDGPGFSCGTFAGMRVCGTRDANGVYNNYDLHFATHWGGVTAPTVMTMTCGGNVGIGTTTPSAILNIASSSPKIRLNPTTQNNATAIEFGVLNAGTCAYAKIDAVNAQNYDTNLRFFTNGAGDATQVERMRITYTGVVGIGTSSPSNHQGVPGLTVSGTSGNRGIIEVWDGTSGKSIFQQVGGSTYIGQLCKGSGAGDLYLLTGGNGTAANVSMFISCAGQTGIGTTSPATYGALAIRTAVCLNSKNVSLSTSDATNSTFDVRHPIASVVDLNSQDSSLTFSNTTSGTNGTERMRITCAGNVGINCATPTYKLHVNGTFYAAGSSCEYKTQICQYNTDSCMFMKLTPVTYQYKDEWCHLGKELKSETQIGLIAEDVAEVYPELAILVNEDDQKIVRNVDYEKLSIVLLSEVQKLRKELDELKTK